MSISLKKIFAPLALTVVLAGCGGESPQDLARKPAVIDAMVQKSLQTCNTGPVNPDAASYETRLRGVLSGDATATLDEMQKQNLTVCLDQRLTQQQTGFWDVRIKAAMYREPGQGGIVSLWDDGRPSSEDTFWTQNQRRWGTTSLRKLAWNFQKGNIEASDKVLYGDLGGCGKGCTTVYWHDTAHFDKDTQRKNPQLAKPPVPLPAAKPVS